jgi:hypothetical protein
MNSCFTLTIYNECILSFQCGRTFVSVLFNEAVSISLFHHCSLHMRYDLVRDGTNNIQN